MPEPFELAGTSPIVSDTVRQVGRAASDSRGVLITAEPGLDGEAVARVIHSRAGTAGPFVAVSCEGAAPRELERALFGGPARARTGLDAVSAASALYRARGGTLFLEQPGDLPDPLQRRLARVLRDGEVRGPRRAGGPIPLDVRPVASVRQEPGDALRDELLRRLPIRIDVPALRLRRSDVPAIAEAMLRSRSATRRFTPAALTVLGALPWRRNLAELKRLIDQLAAAPGDELIRQEDVLAEVQLDRVTSRPAGTLREARRQFEKEYIAAVLREHDGQVRDAARALGIERANLYRKARQLGIPLRAEPAVGRNGR